MNKKVKAKMYKGMTAPIVELSEEELAEASGGTINVSLDSLKTDLHNQTYGMVIGSTGCISNPGGPSC
jgi:hypothetical protein